MVINRMGLNSSMINSSDNIENSRLNIIEPEKVKNKKRKASPPPAPPLPPPISLTKRSTRSAAMKGLILSDI